MSATDGTRDPEPVGSYVVGLPVVVTVYPSGYVRFDVDLTEAAVYDDSASYGDDDAPMTDEQVDEILATVQARLDAGADYDVFRGA